MSDSMSPLENLRVAAGLSAALAVLVFLNSLGNGFSYDDLHIMLENERIHGWDRFWEAITTPYWPIEEGEALGLWRPVASGAYWLLWNAFGGSPLPFHVLNVAAHAGVTVLVTLLLGRLLPVGAAFIGGMIFAVHPVHTEVVANGVGFAELFGAAAMLVGCLLFLRWRSEPFTAARILALSGVLVAGMLAKESAITVLGLFFLLDGFLDNTTLSGLGAYIRRRWALYAAMVGAAGLVFVARYQVLGSVADPLPPLGAELLLEVPRIWTLGEIWTHYVRLLFFPLDLSVEYSPGVIPIQLDWGPTNTLGAFLGLGFLVLALVGWRRWRPAGESARAMAAGIVWFVITISPVTNFFFLSGTLLGERLLYAPSVGFSLGAGWALWMFVQRRTRITWAVVVVALVLGSLRTLERNPTWKDTETTFLTLIATHLEAGRAQWVVGDTFWEENHVSAALRSYRYAIGSVGAGYSLLSEITKKLLGIQRYEQAETLARMLWDDEPTWSGGPGLLAVALQGQERWEEAAEWGEIAKELEPDDPVTRHVLSDIYRRLERWDQAIAERQAAIDLGEDEHWQQWMWLAELHAARGDTAAALALTDSSRVRAATPEAQASLDTLRVYLTGQRAGSIPVQDGPMAVRTDVPPGDPN